MKTYPLLQAQLGIFVDCIKYPESTQYNIPSITKLPEGVEPDALQRAIERIYRCRRELRIRFILDEGGNPLQYVPEEDSFRVIRKKLPKSELEAYAEAFIRPYDLLGGEPLFRAEILETEAGNYVLFDYHHIVMDGESSVALFTKKDMAAAFQGTLEPSEYGMLDHTLTQTLSGAAYERDKEYYQSRFRGMPLATLSAGSGNPVGKIVRESVRLPIEGIDNWCRENGMPVDGLFQAAFSHVLCAFSHEEKIAYSILSNGRFDPKLRDSYGMFVETVPVLIEETAGMSVRDLILECAMEKMKGIRHHYYPFTHFCRDLKTDPGVSFNFMSLSKEEEYFYFGREKSPVRQLDPDQGTSDLTVSIYCSDTDYEIRVTSSEKLNARPLLRNVASAMKNAVQYMLVSLDRPAVGIPLLSAEETETICALSAGESFASGDGTWVDLVVSAARKYPQQVAVRDAKGVLTYEEMDRLSDSVAAYLIERGVAPGQFVAVRMDRVKEFAAALLGVMKAGAAYVPIDNAYPEDRIQYMLHDAQAEIVLTKELVDQIRRDWADASPVNRAVSNGCAYMIYTSGSTGRPKGIIQSHRSLKHFTSWRVQKLGITKDKQYAHFNSFAFDGSLDDLACPLAAGAAVHILDDALRTDIPALCDYLSEQGISGLTVSTQFGMELIKFARNLPLEYLMMGGETLLPVGKTAYRVINGYGPTEFTVCASYYTVRGDERQIPIGRPVPGCACYICDRHGNLLPRGITGEICLAGPQMAEGYHKQPELTKEVFTRLYIGGADIPVYRTGDQGCYDPDGQLVYAGRIDGQVKLRGFRVEFGEIESCAARHPLVTQAVADVRRDQLVLYYTAEKAIDTEEFIAFLSRSLPDYMVPTHTIRVASIPTTAGGKTDKSALPDPDSDGLRMLAPENEAERQIFALAADVLQTGKFGVTDNLIGLGLTSIAMMRLSAVIKKNLGVNITVAQLMKAPRVRDIAALAGRTENVGSVVAAADKRPYYPITENQRGVYLDWERNPDTLQYNVPSLYLMHDVDAEALAKAARTVVDAHPYLKTGFAYIDGDLVQLSREEAAQVTLTTLREEPDRAFFQAKMRPFDLLTDRLYRIEVVSFGTTTWLFMDMHHIIFDGMSGGLLVRDILAAYRGDAVTSESVTAYDFALFEREYARSEHYEADQKYFDALVSDAESAVYPDSTEPDGSAYETLTTRIDAGAIDAFCHRHRVTAASFLQAAFSWTIQATIRQDSLIYATLSNGRSADVALLGCVGMFVRTLPVVLHWHKDRTLTSADYVRQIYEQMQETTARELYPYTKLVEEHAISAGMLFAFQGGVFESGEVTGALQLPLRLDAAKFPLSVTVYPERGDYVFLLEYDGRRYSAADMRALGQAMCAVADSFVKERFLMQVRLFAEAEQRRLLGMSAGETMDYDRDKTWLDLFRAAVAKYPERLAVEDDKSSITYGELDRQSDRLAAWLIDEGVEIDDFVAVKMDRVKEFIIAVTGIHKAGAAYVPIDLAYPEDRIRYMLEDSEARLVLDEAAVKAVADSSKSAAKVCRSSPDRLAYMIYTSGTTGRPKGAILHQAGLMNFTLATVAQNALTEEDRIGLHFSFSFDSHIEDVFPVLSAGAAICIMPEEIRREPEQIYAFIKSRRITGGGFTTAIGKMLVSGFDLPQRYVTMIGEPLTDVISGECQIVNRYGPTECTNVVSLFKLEAGKSYRRIPIGRAMPNGYIFIVDRNGQLLPPGLIGEICYAGPQVGRGYWKLPEKTAQVFEDCPFVKGLSMYHTGDLGKYDENGWIECFGRIDNQIKLRGYRIELGEIEACAARFEDVRVAAAAVRQDRLVLYYCAQEGVTLDEQKLREYLAGMLTDYMLPSVIVCLKAMPYTPSGKINRKALPDPVLKDQAFTAPETAAEEALWHLAAEVLGTEHFGVTDDLIACGMSSIAMMRFVARIRQMLERKITVARALKAATIRQIAAIWDEREAPSGGIPIHAPREYYPITENQRGVYLDWEKNRESIQYNVPYLYEFKDADADALKEAVKAAIRTHTGLATRFAFVDGDLMQKRMTEEPEVVRTECVEEPTLAWFQDKVRPFDLLRDRLYRVEVASWGGKTWLFIDVHHIVYDGLSNGLLLRDILSSYRGGSVTTETVTSYDMALYERDYIDSEAFREAQTYFADLLADGDAATYPNSTHPDGCACAVCVKRIPAADIDGFCRRNGVTHAGFMLSAVAETLKRLTRQDKAVFATISNGRSADPALLGCTGMFVRTLPVAVSAGTGPDQPVAEFVGKLTRQLRQTMDRELYPYTRIVADHALQAEIVYAYQGDVQENMASEGVTQLPLILNAVKFPITVTVYPDAGDYVIRMEYDGTRYNREDMLTLAQAVGNVARSLATGRTLRDVRLIDEAEEQSIAALSYEDGPWYDEKETWVDLFLQNAAADPAQTAVVDHDSSLTYGELDVASNAVAAWLLAQGVKPKEFIGINTGRVKEFVIAALGVQRAGAACLPIEEEDYPRERIAYMLEDSGARLVITRESVAQAMEEYRDAAPTNLAERDGYTYLFYTSGSTGKPKAVVLGHRGVYYFARYMMEKLDVRRGGRYGMNSSLSFDGSLMGYLAPLAAGGTAHIFDEHLRKEMIEIDHYISGHHLTGMFVTTQFGLELIRYNPNTELEHLLIGGEKLPPMELPRVKLINLYGPTEFSVIVASHPVDNGNDDNIPIGRPAPRHAGYVCDIYGSLVPKGALGELCLAGPQIGLGYWKRPELTAEKFTQITVLGRKVKVYRTGDMVRYNEDGELEFHGRIDHLIKLRGYRIELGEIETCAVRYPGIAMAAAAVKQDKLILYYQPEAGQTINEKELRLHMAKTLASYMLPAIYVCMEKLPWNTNNKINRKALPDPDVRGILMVPPATELEKSLFTIASELLKTDRFGVTDDMMSLGMSSITMMRYMAAIQTGLGKNVTIAEISAAPMVRDIAERIEEKERLEGGLGFAIPDYEKQEHYPITENQRGVYLDWEMHKDTLQYNVPALYLLRGVDAEKLADAVRYAVNAHEYLMTRFSYEDGDLMQRLVWEDAQVDFTVLEKAPEIGYFQDKVLPFDLLHDRLYRMEVVSFGDQCWLFMDVHHIIYDGLSNGLLMKDILSVYRGGAPTAESVTAYDFALYEQSWQDSEEYREAKAYFDGLVRGVETAAYPDSPKPDGAGCGTVSFTVAADAIDEFCKAHRVTVASFLQAALAETLNRITRQDDLLYATISNGRSADPRLLSSIGMFVRTLPVVLRTSSDPEQSTEDYVQSFHEMLRNITRWEMYPYTRIVEEYGIHPDVLFVFQGGIFEGGEAEGATRIALTLNTIKFPITVTIYPNQGQYVIMVEYDGVRFGKADMQTLASAIGQAALSLAEKRLVREVSLVSREELERIVRISTGSIAAPLEFDRSKTWVDLFLRAVDKYPDKVVVIDSTSSMTYRELDDQSNKIAAYLIEHQVKPGDYVAVVMGRVKEFLSAAVGITKAGAAYVPIDPAYPEERIQYIKDDCATPVVLTEELVFDILANKGECPRVDLSTPDHIAYMIYTSGSTGKPKGVMIRHSSMSHYVRAIIKEFNMGPGTRIGNHASFSFDTSVENMYPAICSGGATVIVPEDARKDMELLYEFLTKHRVTGINLNAQLGQLLGSQHELDMEYISLSGEPMSAIPMCKGQVYNSYGPTETTVVVANNPLPKDFSEKRFPIGKPLVGTNMYVADKKNQLLPLGVAGELYIGGVQVAVGYHNKPELTAEKFITMDILGKSERVYKSGDLGRYLPDGKIDCLGRVDFQVKFRGFRIELGEIENRTMKYPGIHQAAAVIRNDQLVLYYTTLEDVAGKLDSDKIREFLAAQMPEYMVPTVYMHIDGMPLTTNGKLNRKALPDPEYEGIRMLPPETELERALLDIAASTLHSDQFGVTDNLVSVGLNSIAAMRYVAAIKKELGEVITVAQLMKAPTVRSIAEGLAAANREETRTSIPAYEKQEYYPITENQKGVYLDWEMNRDTLQYNVPYLYMLENVDSFRLAQAVKTAVDGHEYLKTRLEYKDGKVVQRRFVEDCQISFSKIRPGEELAYYQSRVRPFDLMGERLYRIEVGSCDNRTWLFIDIHHIIFDGLSAGVLMKDILSAYEGGSLTEESITAYEYALYEQEEYIGSEAFREAKGYFDTLLSGAEAASYTGTGMPDGQSVGRVTAQVDASLIDRFCHQHKVTAASFMQTAFAETLTRITRQDKAFYVTISNGRFIDPALLSCVGMFARTLPVVAERSGETESVLDAVRQTEQQIRQATAREMYPYTQIVTDRKERAEIIYIFQGGVFENGEIEGIRQISLDTNAPKFGIAVTVYPEGGCYQILIEYDGSRYGREEMALISKAIGNVAQSMTKEHSLAKVCMTGEDEELGLEALSTGEPIEYDTTETWVGQFAKAAASFPEHKAVVDSLGSMSYGELDKASDAVAASLVSRGVEENSFVAVRIGRQREFVTAVLGIMKAGAAYVPVDPAYPEERIAYMLRDSGAGVTLTAESVQAAMDQFSDAEPIRRDSVNGYAYMIYTSGSTGMPKGVVQSHRSLHHFVEWRTKALNIRPEGNYAHFNSFSFDGSLDDLCCPLAIGAAVHILDEDLRTDLAGLANYIRREKINGFTASTLFGMELIKFDPKLPLDYLMMGGERLLPSGETAFRVINGYGPTEFTVCSSFYVLDGKETEVPIGRPVPGTASYLCDGRGRLVPQGMAGELYLAGPQMAEGYWKQPEMTADRFTDIVVNGERIKAYRTGDLARYGKDRQLMYIGRIDEQVKLRGFRIEFGEIEKCAARYPGVAQAVADVRRDQLVLYYTIREDQADQTRMEEDLRNFLGQSLTDYMIPSRYIRVETIPVTVNGKADRKALPDPELMRDGSFVEPRNWYEQAVADSIAETLGLTEPVGATDSFYTLGGDSIKALRFISNLHKRGITLRLSQVKELEAVDKIAAWVEAEQASCSISQEPIEGPVGDSAIVAFFKDLKLPQEDRFTQQVLLGMRERADADKLKMALQALTWQHDMLRAILKDGQLQIQSADTQIPLEEINLADDGRTLDQVIRDVQLGIRMESALFCAVLIHGETEDLIFLLAQHLIVDGVSWRIILSDLETAYTQLLSGRKPMLEAKTSTYKDYVEALEQYRNSDELLSEIPYWNDVQKKLLAMPHSKAKDYTRRFAVVARAMDAEETRLILRADRSKIHLNMNDVLITAVARAYGRQRGTADVSIQLEGHGREDFSDTLHTTRTVGWFTSIYPVVLTGLSEGTEGEEALRRDLVRVKETLHRIPRNGVGYNILRFVEGSTPAAYSAEEIAPISFNYLGETGSAEGDGMFRMLPMTAAGDKDENTFGSDLNINCVVVNGVFRLELSYNECAYDAQAMEALAQDILSELKKESVYLNSLKAEIPTAGDFGEKQWTEDEFERVYQVFADRDEPIRTLRRLGGEEAEAIEKWSAEAGLDHYAYTGAFALGYHPDKKELSRAFDRLTGICDVFGAAYVHKGVSSPRMVYPDRRIGVEYVECPEGIDTSAQAMALRDTLRLETVDSAQDALLRVICVMKDGRCQSFAAAVHPVVSAICGISGYLLVVKLLANIAFDTNVSFPITNLADPYDPVRHPRLERCGVRVCEFYSPYDENKPTMVFVLGIVLQMSVQHLLDDWSRRFNIIVIEDINYNYNQLFYRENYDYVVHFYATLLELMIPKKDGVFGYIGYSFGGEVGYSLAVKMDRIRHSKPMVFLGDSDMVPSQGADFAKEYVQDDLDEFLLEKFKENDIPVEDMLFAYSMLSFLNAGDKTFEPYYGRTILLLASFNNTREQVELRITLARMHARNFRVIDFPDRDHFNLHNNPDMLPVYDEMFDEIMSKETKDTQY